MKNFKWLPKTVNVISQAVLALLLFSCGEKKTVNIITSIKPAYSMACNLVPGTSINVKYIDGDELMMNELAAYFKEVYKSEEFKKLSKDTDAVFNMSSIWNEDELYVYTALNNIYVVPFDVTLPLNPALQGVSVCEVPKIDESGKVVEGEKVPSPYVWLSLSNAVTMTDIIANGMKEMSPKDAATIDKNAKEYTNKILSLKAEYEEKFLNVDVTPVAAFTSDFVYLTNNFNIFTEELLLKDVYSYEDADWEKLDDIVENRGVKVFLSSFVDEGVSEHLSKHEGVKFAVLNTMDDGMDDGIEDKEIYESEAGEWYLAVMRNNLEMLYGAFENNSQR